MSLGDYELPSYNQHANNRAPADPQVEHTYRLTRNGRPFVTLAMKSGAVDADHTPLMHQGQTLSGSITLDLYDGVNVRSLNVQVIGELKLQLNAHHRFLSMRTELYTAETRDIPSNQPRERGVSIAYDENRKKFLLPSSVKDSATKFSIDYHVVVHVKTGFLSSGHKLVCPFEYIPILRPSLPSLLHQIARLEGTSILGPYDDPEGWKTLSAVDMSGRLFNSKRVVMTCTLSVPLPLCYTRGTSISIHLVLSSEDEQALGILCSPHAPKVHLIRTLTYPHAGYMLSTFGESARPQISYTEEVASTAFSVTATNVNNHSESSTNTRVLCGQLSVPGNLVPEFHMLSYDMQYSIAIYPFEAVGFTPGAPVRKPLLEQTVQIVTANADMPQGPSVAPPNYIAEFP
ncbi:hypothetical protein BDW22DRAFT_1357474 [Trametopsis cervina]|nr:hypothetical protein BDW22DRAFT_1357474 [Trametopsis cervina]